MNRRYAFPEEHEECEKSQAILHGEGWVGDQAKKLLAWIAPKDMSASVKAMMAKYGSQKITAITVSRIPITSIYEKILRKVATVPKEFDKIYHLYMLFTMDSGAVLLCERNHTFQLRVATEKDKNEPSTKATITPMTLNDAMTKFIEEAKKRNPSHGPWRYAALPNGTTPSNNCQDMVLSWLKGMGSLTAAISNFVKQDIDKLLPQAALDTTQGLTDIAGAIGQHILGRGEEKIDPKEYLREVAKELHKPVKHKFPTRMVFVDYKDQTWAMDLADMNTWKAENDGYCFILVVIDVYTRWAAARPLKTKTGKEVLNALKNIIAESKRQPKGLWVDEGKEFLNKEMKSWREEKGINLFHTYGRGKSVIVERFNRTLKTTMWRTLTERNSHEWVPLLPELIDDYNDTTHGRMKMTPDEASAHPAEVKKVWDRLRRRERPSAHITELKKDEVVRVSRAKGVFEKGYDVNWSRQTFIIDRVNNQQFPPLYYLKEYDSHEPVKGGFYEEELQRVGSPHTFLIDHVIKEKGKGDKKMLFVRWLGFGPESDSWIPASDAVDV